MTLHFSYNHTLNIRYNAKTPLKTGNNNVKTSKSLILWRFAVIINSVQCPYSSGGAPYLFLFLSPLIKHNIKKINGENMKLSIYHQPLKPQSCKRLTVKE